MAAYLRYRGLWAAFRPFQVTRAEEQYQTQIPDAESSAVSGHVLRISYNFFKKQKYILHEDLI